MALFIILEEERKKQFVLRRAEGKTEVRLGVTQILSADINPSMGQTGDGWLPL